MILPKTFRHILLHVLLAGLLLFQERPSLMSQEPTDAFETSIFLNISQLGTFEMPALIVGREAYLPVTPVFTLLRVKHTPSLNFDSIYGYFGHPDHDFVIDRDNYLIRYQDNTISIDPKDMILTESALYLHPDIYKSVFGLEFVFNFRAFSATLNTQVELPVIRLMRQEKMRANLAHLEGKITVDTTIGKRYPMFHFGMADWSVFGTQEVNGPSTYDATVSLGSVILGGATNLTLHYNNHQPFTEEEQYYLWHFVNNDFKYLRQAKLGKIAPEKIVSLYDPIVGAEISNIPTTFRRAFCTYTISDYTEPGWIVELYVNHILIQYTTSDASGFYRFDVPLVYGNTSVTLRFYGPYGEERMLEKSILIPVNFLPPGVFE